MSTADPVFFFEVSSPWYRERPVKWAFALSLLAHAAAIALLPGLRLRLPEEPAPLIVELAPLAQPDTIAPEMSAPLPVEQPMKKATPPARERPSLPPTPLVERSEPQAPPPVEPRREIAPQLPAPAPVPEVRPEPPPPPVLARVEPQSAPEVQSAPEPAPRVEPQVIAKAEPPAPQVRQAPATLDTGALKAYGETLARALGKKTNYPRLARMRNWQGTTQLKLRIGPDGKLQGVSVGRSSGFDLLDAAALQMVQDSLPLPEVPEVLRGRELTMTVPIVFRLESL